MPSPYAHFIAGTLLTTRYIKTQKPARKALENAAIILLFSLMPDLDVIPGLIAGDIAAYHNQIGHSPFFLLVVATVSMVFIRRFLLPHRHYLSLLSLAILALSLHLFMDWLTNGRGLLLLWPLQNTRFSAPATPFYGVRYSNGLFSPQLWITFFNESLIMGTVTFIALAIRSRRKKPKVNN